MRTKARHRGLPTGHRSAPTASAVRVGALAFMLAGCSSVLGPRPDPSRFYVLHAESSGQVMPATRATRDRSYGVGPVGIPDYLKRPSVITRVSESQVDPSPIDRWAEPIEKGVPRVLVDDLRVLLGSERIIQYPWYASDRPDLQILVDLQRLERSPDGRALVDAHWAIRRTSDNTILRTGDTRTRVEPPTPDADGSIAAQSAALGVVARDVATAIRDLLPR